MPPLLLFLLTHNTTLTNTCQQKSHKLLQNSKFIDNLRCLMLLYIKNTDGIFMPLKKLKHCKLLQEVIF